MDLRKKAHVAWLTQIDMSSKFFSEMTRKRQAKNSILGSIEANGLPTVTLDVMKEHTKQHFINLFDCEERSTPFMAMDLPIKVSNELNAWFRCYLKEEEIKDSLFTMKKDKCQAWTGLWWILSNIIGRWSSPISLVWFYISFDIGFWIENYIIHT